MSKKLEIIEYFFDEVWTKENTSVIKEVFVPDSNDQRTAAGLHKEEKLSPDDFIGFQQSLLQLATNMKIEVVQSCEDGDWIVVRCKVTAENSSNGAPVKMEGTGWARITDGKIREAYNFYDFMTLFEGLSLLPEDTMARCLAGKKV